jgi:hypothetical protein
MNTWNFGWPAPLCATVNCGSAKTLMVVPPGERPGDPDRLDPDFASAAAQPAHATGVVTVHGSSD